MDTRNRSGQQLSVVLPEETMERLRSASRFAGMTQASIVEWALDDFLHNGGLARKLGEIATTIGDELTHTSAQEV